MKKLKNSVLVILLIILSIPLTVNVKAENTINIHYFYDKFCSNCSDAEAYLNDLAADNYNLVIVKYEVIKSKENESLFFAVKDAFGRNSNSVPYIVIGGVDFPNFYNSKEKIEEVIEYYESNSFVDVVEKVKNDEVILESDLDVNLFSDQSDQYSDQYVVDVPLFGEIDLANTTLFFGAVIVGLVDGFNPCAMWVLIFMIMMLINLKDRKRFLILGLTFILTSGIVYFLIMMSWLQIVIALSTINIVKILIGILALVFSLYSFKSFWVKRKEEIGCEVTSKNQRKILSSKLTKIIQKESLVLAILGIIIVSISVNFIELVCSLVLPLFYTSLLAMHGLSTMASAGYILVYVLFFILDDLIIFLLAFFTLKVTGISNRYMKYTHLIGGIIMFIIGIGLLFFPELLLL